MNRQLITFVLALACSGLSAAEFFVAPAGKDANPGTKEQPFATLERAREAVRQIKQAGPLKEPVTVCVRGGSYRISASLILEVQDSGTEAVPIVWQAAPGEEVRLCDGPALSTKAFVPVTDEKVLARLDPAARGQVLQINLREIGVTELGSYPDLFRGAPAVPELFFNDQRMTLARWPNEGWATIARMIDSGTSSDPPTNEPPRPGTFEYLCA